MLKYSSSKHIFEYLTLLFEKMIQYQQVPYLFNISILKPIIKDTNKPNNDLNNLRPVAISDAISNLYEAVLLRELERNYTDHDKQFGFKKNSSCNHALFTLKQAIRLSNFTKNRLYVCAIDASKAFDKVNREKLWMKMIQKKLEPAIISAIINYYKESLMIIKNGVELSSHFKTTLGVRQGGTMSPKLFSIYIDELIVNIEAKTSGIKVPDGPKIDIIVYADDVLLISTTKSDLQSQINTVESYGVENEIKYNPEKTTLMIFNEKVSRTVETKKLDTWQDDVKLNNIPIKRVKNMKYLGVEISDDDKNKQHLDKRNKSAIIALAKIKKIGLASTNIHPMTKGHLYNTHIRPILYYGIENIYLNKTEKNKIKRIEGNLIKMLIGIPSRCRTTNLIKTLKIEPTEWRIETLKCGFFNRLQNNNYTKMILDSVKNLSITGDITREISELRDKFHFPNT